MSALVVDVAKMTGTPGASREIFANEALPGLRGALAYVDESEPVDVEVEAESLIEGIGVHGTVSGSFHVTCSRCLATYEQRFEQEVDEIFYFREGEEDAYKISGGEIDLEPMVRDAVVLAIPLRPLHKVDCRGLCPACGADRNVVDCGHREEMVDIRWTPLRGLFNQVIETKAEGS